MNEEMNNNYNNTPNYNYEKKNNGVKVLLIIVIILLLCLIGLTAYKLFVVDKKDDNKNNNIVENENNDNREQNINNSYIQNKIYKKNINNKEVSIELKFYKEIENNEDIYTYIKYDIYVNNKLLPLDTLTYDLYSNGKSVYKENLSKQNYWYVAINDDISNTISKIESLFNEGIGIIKIDKEYLYFKTYTSDLTGKKGTFIVVLNENGKPITTEMLTLNGQYIEKAYNCNYDYYKNKNEFDKNMDSSYYIDNEKGIYILSQGSIDSPTTVNEYLITINNDTATRTLINTCEAELSGSVY